MRLLIDRLRSALAAICLAALTALGAGLVATPAHADWVRNDQWQLGALNAVATWQHSTGGGVVVAVLDSGVDASHPDLAGQVLPGTDLVDGTTDGRVDAVGHGTTVAALIAGRRDEDGVVGLAPDAKILPVRVLDSHNRYEDASIVAQGLRWAVDHGATVVNLSLGGLAHSDVLADALAYAADHNVVVVACTGNLAQTSGGYPQVWYPAREPGVVAVTGLRNPPSAQVGSDWLGKQGTTEAAAGDELWSGSLTGPETVLSAPAVNLVGARPGGYWRVQGTSFAAPLVAGAAALVRARYPELSAANVINRLIGTATDLGAAGRDDKYGFGLVDPLAAVTAEVADVRDNPLLQVRQLSQPAKGANHVGGSAPEGWGPAGAGNPAGPTGPVSESTGPNTEPSGHHRTGALAYVGGTGPSLVIAVLMIGVLVAAMGVRHEYVKRYLRRARHSR